MSLNAQFRSVLEAGDAAMARRAWAQVAPHLPQPKDDGEAEILLHLARTQAGSIAFRQRAYSHRWLTERDLPSGLPDHMKPRAERMYPRIAEAVGIAVVSPSAAMQPAADLIRGAMERAVQHCYADGRTEPGFVKAQMQLAKADETRRLFGSITIPREAARGQ